MSGPHGWAWGEDRPPSSLEQPKPYLPLPPSRVMESAYPLFYTGLAALSAIRWQRWEQETYVPEESGSFPELAQYRQDRINEMTSESYGRALDNLFHHVGSPALNSALEEVVTYQLHDLHFILPSRAVYKKAHTDIMPHHPEQVAQASAIVGNTHPMPEGHDMKFGLMSHVVNGLPIFGDVDFWSHLHSQYPNTFTRLTDFWHNQASGVEARNGTRSNRIVYPTPFLHEFFPNAYEFLLSVDDRFKTKDKKPYI